jgi:hypothetical protein
MQSVVQRRAGSLPKVYQQEYAQPLLNNFDQFLSEIDSDPTFTETICAAVYQHSSDFVAARGYLNRFQAVCATLYDDFLNNEVRKKLNLPLIEKFPPLAMFQKVRTRLRRVRCVRQSLTRACRGPEKTER